MELFLRAFGNSKKLTIKERAEEVNQIHLKVSEILAIDSWFLWSKTKTTLNIKDTQLSFPLIYAEVKSGLNTGLATRTRYKDDDIADISSSCIFHTDSIKDLSIKYEIGYPSSNISSGLKICIDNIQKLSEEKIMALSKLFIKEWKPESLTVTEDDFFHEVSKAYDLKVPFTGWFTYLSYDILNQDFIDSISTKKNEIENIGLMYFISNHPFDIKDKESVSKALDFERELKKHNIKHSNKK